MNVEIYRIGEDRWHLVNNAGEVCLLEDLPTFFETYDFTNSAGVVTKWKILFLQVARKSDSFDFFGELYKP